MNPYVEPHQRAPELRHADAHDQYQQRLDAQSPDDVADAMSDADAAEHGREWVRMSGAPTRTAAEEAALRDAMWRRGRELFVAYARDLP